MELEQYLEKSYTRIGKEETNYYVLGDLENLSANALYTGKPMFLPSRKPFLPSKKPFQEFTHFKSTMRFDDHPPIGKHINLETWLGLKGNKKGRYLKLGNMHIDLEDD